MHVADRLGAEALLLHRANPCGHVPDIQCADSHSPKVRVDVRGEHVPIIADRLRRRLHQQIDVFGDDAVNSPGALFVGVQHGVRYFPCVAVQFEGSLVEHRLGFNVERPSALDTLTIAPTNSEVLGSILAGALTDASHGAPT
ncbi:hypothetical protein D9M72_560620 [compost metagenome]